MFQCICIIFRDALKHVGVLAIYKRLFIYIVHLLVWNINCTRWTIHTSKPARFFSLTDENVSLDNFLFLTF